VLAFVYVRSSVVELFFHVSLRLAGEVVGRGDNLMFTNCAVSCLADCVPSDTLYTYDVVFMGRFVIN
jgi:hypothetical protein